MFRLKTIAPEEATGELKAAYDMFPPAVGVPAPFLLMSASPGLALAQGGMLRHHRSQTEYSPECAASIRFLAANAAGADYCVMLNSKILAAMGGLTKEDLAAMLDDPDNAPLTDGEKQLLRFAVAVVAAPETITDQDVDALRQAGFTDAAILDASAQACNMLVVGRLMKAFRG